MNKKIAELCFLGIFFITGGTLAHTGPMRLSGPAFDGPVGDSHLPKGLFAVHAKARISALKNLSPGFEEQALHQKLMEMALMDVSLEVRREAEKALSRIQPLSEKEQNWQFQLSSPFLHERKSAMVLIESSHPYLQYTVLKEVVFSPGSLTQAYPVEEDHIKELKKNLSIATHLFISSHLLGQKVLVSTLRQPDLAGISRQILSSITLSPHIQWELIRVVTALSSNHNSPIPRDQAFMVMSQTKTLDLAMELELLQLAMTEELLSSTKEPVTLPFSLDQQRNLSALEGSGFQPPLPKEFLAGSGQASPSNVTYSLLQNRRELHHETEKGLAERMISLSPDVSSLIRKRAKNLLEQQYFLRPATEQILVRGLLSSSSEIMKMVETFFYNHTPHSDTVDTLIRIMSADYSSPQAKKIARNILFRIHHLKPEQERKLGWLFLCQRVFR